MKKKIFFGILLVGLLAFFLYDRLQPPADILNKPAPLFETSDLDGHVFKLEDLLYHKVILINFWATWCPPCQEEIPILNTLSQQIDPNSFAIIGLMEDEAPTEEMLKTSLNHFRQKTPILFPVFQDQDGLIAELYGTYKIPESYLIDLKGRIIHKHYGAMTKWDRDDLVKLIQKVISAK